MGTRIGFHARWRSVFRLSLLLPYSCLALGASEISPHSERALEQLIELDEVLVSGAKPNRKLSEIISWMQRLVGQFTYEGHVDLKGQGEAGDQQTLHGVGNCVPFGAAPAVQCDITVAWPELRTDKKEQVPGGLHTLDPAIILYGLDPYEPGIRFMLVDSRGIAEPALGLLIGDTLVAREPCASEFENCQRVTRITAELDAKAIEMHIDIYFDYRRTLAYRFLLRRMPVPPTPVPEVPN